MLGRSRTVHPTSQNFKANAREALADPQLQRALSFVKSGLIGRRQAAAERLPEFEALRDAAKDIKDHTLCHLDLYLERYEEAVRTAGGHVHFARDAREARDIALAICRAGAERKVRFSAAAQRRLLARPGSEKGGRPEGRNAPILAALVA